MPILSNPRHERFAQSLAQGSTADEAYVLAGYKKSRAAASRMSTNVSIKARVAELQARVADGIVITRQWVIERLVANVERAMKDDDGAVANRALELLGKEVGMFVDRSEVKQTTYTVSPEPTEAEWLAEHAQDEPARH